MLKDGIIKININKMLMVISVITLGYFALSDSPIGMFIPSSMQCIYLMILSVLLLINLFIKKMKLRPLAIVFVLMAVLIFINAYFPLYSHRLWCYITSFLVCLSANKWNDNWIKYFLNTLRIGYWFYAATTLLSYVSSGFYYSFVLPFFRGFDTYHSIQGSYSRGFMSGFTAHYSINGMYLVVGLMIAAVLCISSNYKKHRIETLVMAFALLTTGKRAHILFGLAALFFMYCIIKLPENFKGVMKILGIVVAALIAFVIMLNTVPALQNFMSRFDNMEDDGAVANRFAFWKLAFSLFAQSPLTGIGWGQFRYFSARALNYEAYTHNVYLEILCENGVFGTLLFYGFFIVSYILTIKLLYKLAKDRLLGTQRMAYVMFSFTMQTFFLMYCVTGNPLYDRIMYIPYFIACGIMYYYRRMSTKEKVLRYQMNSVLVPVIQNELNDL